MKFEKGLGNQLIIRLLIPAIILLSIAGIPVFSQPQSVDVYAGSPGPVVTYPPNCKSDFEKLCAVYSLIEQMRLEHNQTAELAKSNPEKYLKSGKFKTYAEASKKKLKLLLAERNRLIESIRWDNYTLEQWEVISGLSAREQESIYKALFGNKESLKTQNTEATTHLLDELKALDLDKLPDSPIHDPTEDLSAYVEDDDDSKLTVTADRVTWTNQDAVSSETALLYDDKGSGHFDGNWEILFKTLATSGDNDYACHIAVCGTDGEDYGTVLWDAGKHQQSAWWYIYNTPRLGVNEVDGTSAYYDRATLSFGTTYFVEFERDESVGTYGTIYAYICTGDYWDNGGTQVSTESVALHSSKKDFDIFMVFQSLSDAGSSLVGTGWAELFDLQEEAPLAVTSQEAIDITRTTATAIGNITNIGGENCTIRGAEYGYSPGAYTANVTEEGSFGTGTFNVNLSGLNEDDVVYWRAMAYNPSGWVYGAEHKFSTSYWFDEIYETVTNFESLGEWDLVVGTTLTSDNVNFQKETQGIRWSCTNGTDTIADLTVSLNATAHHFATWVYIEDMDDLLEFYIQLQVNGDWDKYFYIYEGPATDRYQDGWNRVCLSRASFTSYGGANVTDWENITTLRIGVDSTANATANVTFDDFRMIDEPENGKITLRFDDTYEDTYTEALTRMNNYGFPGVAAIVVTWVDTEGYMTTAQLTALQNADWDVISHSMTHPHLTALDSGNLTYELSDSQDWLIENGFPKGSRFFAAPYHDWNATVRNAVIIYYDGFQTLVGRYDTDPPVDPYRMIIRDGIADDTPLATVQAYIDLAVEYNAWLTLLFHEISGNLTLFDDILEYIDNSGLDVVTFSDVFGGVTEPTVVTNSATNVEETTATLSGNITNAGSENCTRGFQWDIDSGVPYTDNWTDTGTHGTGNFTHGLTGLTPGELYYFRATANNTAGWGYGDEVTFLTKPLCSDNATSTGNTTTTISLEWTNTTGFDFAEGRISTSSYPTDNTSGSFAFWVTGNTTTIEGLEPNTTYYISIFTHATEGGLFSTADCYETVTDTTDIGTPAVTNNGASGVTDNDAVLNGTITDDGGASCNVTWYWDTTDYGQTDSWTNSANYTGESAGVISHSITDNLTPETLYYFIIKVANAAATAWSATANFTTEAPITAIYPPVDFILTDLGAITISANWTNGLNAVYTMIRVSRTKYPQTTAEGELAYYGDSNSENFTGYALDIYKFFFLHGGSIQIMLRIPAILLWLQSGVKVWKN